MFMCVCGGGGGGIFHVYVWALLNINYRFFMSYRVFKKTIFKTFLID